MRLDILWKLARDERNFKTCAENADSMRTDQDLNDSGKEVLFGGRMCMSEYSGMMMMSGSMAIH
jgi:hypothetical protein